MELRRLAAGAAVSVAAVVAMAGPAFAHECTNASKDEHAPTAGALITFGDGPDPVDITKGVQKRIEQGLIDPDTGEGFHGQVGIDVDGDGLADFTTFIVGPEGELPMTAQLNGSPDHGIVNLCGTGCPEDGE